MKPQPQVRPIHVLVLAEPPLAQRVESAAALDDGPPMVISFSRGDASNRTPVDVVVADRVVPPVQLRATAGGRGIPIGRVYVGVDAINSKWPAQSAVLPTDATEREIRLACVLVAEAVRWRRQSFLRAEKEKRLRRLSYVDALTGVGNLRAWRARLAAACRRVRVEGTPICVALFDVDHFKPINDTWGHATGDEVICAVAERLANSVRDGDFVARLGGDEFGLILANLSAEQGGKIVERVRQNVSSRVVAGGQQPIELGASAGWCAIVSGETPAAVVERADAALRSAKQAGRDQTHASGAAPLTEVGKDRANGEESSR